jgi:hypothetical protein
MVINRWIDGRQMMGRAKARAKAKATNELDY